MVKRSRAILFCIRETKNSVLTESRDPKNYELQVDNVPQLNFTSLTVLRLRVFEILVKICNTVMLQ